MDYYDFEKLSPIGEHLEISLLPIDKTSIDENIIISKTKIKLYPNENSITLQKIQDITTPEDLVKRLKKHKKKDIIKIDKITFKILNITSATEEDAYTKNNVTKELYLLIAKISPSIRSKLIITVFPEKNEYYKTYTIEEKISSEDIKFPDKRKKENKK